MIELTEDEVDPVNFAVDSIVELAKEMPCSDATRLLRGFLILAGDSDSFGEIQKLYQSFAHTHAQLELIEPFQLQFEEVMG